MRKFQGSKVESDTTKQDVTDQKKFFQFHGESYHSFLECCKLHGVSYDAVRNYQKYHEITKEEALEHYISMDKAFLFRNVIYDDFFCCKAYDISPNTVIYHEKNRKISRAEALEYVLSLRKKRSFPYQGKVYPSVQSCCTELGIKKSSVYSRAKQQNCSLQEAVAYLARASPDTSV